MKDILLFIAIIIFFGWLLGGFVFHVAGSMIHLLLVIALILFIIYMVRRV